MKLPALVLIKSANDIGSAVAHRLKREGLRPILVESANPGVIRRLMAFAPAVHEGLAQLEGLQAVRCETEDAVNACWERPLEIPLWVADLDAPPPFPVDVLVDARMRKRHTAPNQLSLAPLVIGLGPGFEAGVHVHAVIETNWGPNLGRVIARGQSEAYTGKHRTVRGFGAQRYIYAPEAGTFRTEQEILAPVSLGQVVGYINDLPLHAEIGGVLRGLAYSGLKVAKGAKVVEVDPTADPANAQGMGERPVRIAQGVLEAILGWTPHTKP